MERIVVLSGPTASGKTQAGIAVCKRLNGEIVSADSMQVYRGMDIGTAKPALAERQDVPHHMLDVCDPKDAYSIAQYEREALACIEDIHGRGKLPVLVGGTAFYIQAILYPMDYNRAPADRTVREELEKRRDLEGIQALYEELERLAPSCAGRLHPNDHKRVMRALEIITLTGMPPLPFQEIDKRAPRFAHSFLALTMPREQLYRRIDLRVDHMIQQGLLQEVAALLKAGVPMESTAMQGLGYKELAAVVQDREEWGQAVERIKQGSRRYAKRQWTWLRNQTKAHWFDVQEQGTGLIDALLGQIQDDIGIGAAR